MTRRSGLLRSIAQAQREAERKRKAQERAQTQAAKAAAQAQKAYERAQIADQKERARLYAESQIAHVAELNDELDSDIIMLNNLLLEALPIDSFIDFQKLKETPNFPVFNPGQLTLAEAPPLPQMYLPPELTGIQKFIPGAKEKHVKETAKAWEIYRAHSAQHATREAISVHYMSYLRPIVQDAWIRLSLMDM